MQRTYSLKKNAQFKYVYRRGASAGAREMVMLYVRGPVLKVGFSVGKKPAAEAAFDKLSRSMQYLLRRQNLLLPDAQKKPRPAEKAADCP